MDDVSNEEWLCRLQGAGREQAIASLRDHMVRGLRAALAGYGSVTAEDIEDFAQEALLKALDNLPSFEGRSRFTTWALKIAIRVALSELRRKRWRDISVEEMVDQYAAMDFTPESLSDPAVTPDLRVAQDALLGVVLGVIAHELTERQRYALAAVVFAGVPVQVVADRMGTTRNTLYKLIHDARRRLKQRLAEHGLTPDEVLSAFAD